MTDDLKTFQFIGGPIDSPDDATEAFTALGHAATAWARIEQHIDALIIHLNNPAFSATLYNERHPVSFSGKLKLLKRWFNSHPALAKYANAFREIASRLKTLGVQRNTYLHSIFKAYDLGSRTLTVHGMKYEGGDDFKISRYEVPIDNVRGFTDVVNKANRYLWHDVTRHLFTPGAVAQLEKP